jgi:hypothetical protein
MRVPSDRFVLRVDTRIAATSASNQFKLATKATASNMTIDWGDGDSVSVSGSALSITKTYTNPGIYLVSVRENVVGGAGYFDFNGALKDAPKVLAIAQWGINKWTNLFGTFAYCANMVAVAADSGAVNTATVGVWDYAFFTNTALRRFPIPDVSGMTSGISIFNPSIDTATWSNLLIKLDATNSRSGVVLGGGTSKYNPEAATARANLVARGWVITDGGPA